MDQNFRKISLIVLVIGLGLMMYPESFELHPGDAQIIVSEDTVTSNLLDEEWVFSFEVGPVVIDDGLGPFILVNNGDEAFLNATVYILEGDQATIFYNASGYEIEFFPPYSETAKYYVEGTVDADSSTELHISFFYMQHMPTILFTDYPYRFFGIGMALVGLIVMSATYIFKTKPKNQ